MPSPNGTPKCVYDETPLVHDHTVDHSTGGTIAKMAGDMLSKVLPDGTKLYRCPTCGWATQFVPQKDSAPRRR